MQDNVEENVQERFRNLSHDEFVTIVNEISEKLNDFLTENKLKVDYVVPMLRSGAVPAVYIANRLNIVKFLPFQSKHITYKNGKETIELLYNPLKSFDISKKEPVFLIVEGNHSTGKSVELCLDELLKAYPNAKILYVCLFKNYNSKNFTDKTVFEYAGRITGYFLPLEECEKLNIDGYSPVYPWETEEDQINHPDDREENIFF